MDALKLSETAMRQRADRADRVVAVGAFIAFLVTGFVVDEPPRESGAGPRAAQQAANAAAHHR